MRQAAIGITFTPLRDKVLVVKRRDVSIWVLPGGGIDGGETPEEAVVREIFEETHVTVTIKRKVAEYTPINCLSGHTHIFECEVIGGTPTITTETRGAGFYEIDKLPELFFYIHEQWIHDALANHPHILNGPLDQITFWRLFKFLFIHPIHVVRFLSSKLGFPMNS